MDVDNVVIGDVCLSHYSRSQGDLWLPPRFGLAY